MSPNYAELQAQDREDSRDRAVMGTIFGGFAAVVALILGIPGKRKKPTPKRRPTRTHR
ncbi:hypothetical protein [Nocardia sp. NPDC050406]|uniref:hypothetical protein n=1 Tax=Nocardia sp. NPDC050406 TaxID=3364318 RepID=UPI0037A44760